MRAGSCYCALISDGTVWCWGYNSFGQSGVPATDGGAPPVGVSIPAQVEGLANVARIALSPSSDFACAVERGGAVLCWGSYAWATLGVSASVDGGQDTSPHPVPVTIRF